MNTRAVKARAGTARADVARAEVARAEVMRAEALLAATTPVLSELVARHGPCPVGTGRQARSHFEALGRAICFQQLAGAAARTIWGRVRALVDGPFTAAAVVAVDVVELRGAGLSGAKAASVLDLATRVDTGALRLGSIGRLDDDAIVSALSEVRGIGRWTAEMFLLFQLGRLDVWPTGDLGVRNGFARVHGLAAVPGARELEAMGDPFRPWRSVLAWYCWRAMDDPAPSLDSLPTGR
jgi:DNA-3-methyladenine glycosylase II